MDRVVHPCAGSACWYTWAADFSIFRGVESAADFHPELGVESDDLGYKGTLELRAKPTFRSRGIPHAEHQCCRTRGKSAVAASGRASVMARPRSLRRNSVSSSRLSRKMASASRCGASSAEIRPRSPNSLS